MANFIDKDEFWQCLKDYKERRIQAEQEGKPEPPIPEFAGKCFMLISENLARRPNFRNYTFVEEMIGDGIEACVRKVKKFDPDYSKQAFSYFTMIVWRTFVNRIRVEATQTKTKKKMIENASVDLMNFLDGDIDQQKLSEIQEEALSHFTQKED